MAGNIKKTVLCYQQRMTHYRVPFFEACKKNLHDKNIDFELIYGEPDSVSLSKKDQGDISWANVVPVRHINLGVGRGVWLPSQGKSPDLVILPQENKFLPNYYWLMRRYFVGQKVAFWGHGKNFQSDNRNSLGERFKNALINRVDWWFAYTEASKDVLVEAGYPTDRISVLDNSIDTADFRRNLDSVTLAETQELRKGICEEVGCNIEHIGLFCGSMYPDKKIDFLIRAADLIKEQIPGFVVVLIGDGPDSYLVKQAQESRPWFRFAGVQTGYEKARFFKIADIVLNPGLVGLHVLDTFCAGLPMVTTLEARHSPEISYLRSGYNGVVVSGDVNNYADTVVNLLRDREQYQKICRNALISSENYSLANMVNRFCDGVVRCLNPI